MLREGDPTFKEELLNYLQKGQILQISNFKDDSSPFAWDCSAWVRTYALFLEERLECFRVLKYDIEAERLMKNTQGASKGHSRTRTLSCSFLLEQMPALQQLLHRLVGCQPEGAAFGNNLVQYALALVIKESFKIYCAVNDGIINLVDMFFEMSKYDAIKALEVYKKAGQQAENLSDFYDLCKNMELARNFQFPTLRQPPPSFLATMEEYIREAPCMSSNSSKNLEYQDINLLTFREEEHAEAIGYIEASVVEAQEEKEEFVEAEVPLERSTVVEPASEITADLLGIEEIRSIASEIEQKNALTLAIIQPCDDSRTSASTDLHSSSSGWELALASSPSNDISNVVGSKLAGGFDKLLLDSLYEDASSRRQIAGGTYIDRLYANSSDSGNPFTMSGGIAPPTDAQMNLIAQQQELYYQQQQQQFYNQQQQQQFYNHQQQQQFYNQQQQQQFYNQQQQQQFYNQQQHQQFYNQQQQMYQHYQQQQQMTMMVPYGYQTQNHHMQVGQTNPFSVPFTEYSQNAPSQGNSSLI